MGQKRACGNGLDGHELVGPKSLFARVRLYDSDWVFWLLMVGRDKARGRYCISQNRRGECRCNVLLEIWWSVWYFAFTVCGWFKMLALCPEQQQHIIMLVFFLRYYSAGHISPPFHIYNFNLLMHRTEIKNAQDKSCISWNVMNKLTNVVWISFLACDLPPNNSELYFTLQELL